MSFSKLPRPILIGLAFAAVVILLGPGGAQGQQQDRRNFWLLNNTGQVISRFYVSPHESGRWGRDVLGRAELMNGLGVLIVFEPDTISSCYMDFRLVFVDGSSQTYEQGRDVCQLSAVQFDRRTSVGLR